MKKLAYIVFILGMVYISAMYQVPSLMAAAIGLGFLMIFLWIGGFIAGRKLVITPASKICTVYQGQPLICSFNIKNPGRFFLGPARIRVWMGRREKDHNIMALFDLTSEDPQNAALRMDPPFCGPMCFHAVEIKLWDPLKLSCVKKKIDFVWEAGILPPVQFLPEAAAKAVAAASGISQAGRSPLDDAGSGNEIRQIREYRDGDLLRHIHWNQTARTDLLWVKEYEEDGFPAIRLFLDRPLSPRSKQDDGQQADAFYRILSAFLYSLLEERISVTVFWKDMHNKNTFSFLAERKEQVPVFLLKLYASDLDSIQYSNALKLTWDLKLYHGDQLIHEFSLDGLKKTSGR